MSFSKRRSVKVKEIRERCIIKAFKLSYQEKYEHVGPKSQVHKMARLQDDEKRLCLVDDLKKFKNHIHSKPKIQLIDLDLEYAKKVADELMWLIESRLDVVKVKEIVEKNLDGHGYD
ncbi:hypothetical protein Tco_0702476 [Tanacetum coccineum]|uniref:Uncharacterized protein n=1 Tax=Tanacetum coccineum TaxID=301880 RepID=A0ABQ4XX47_9ASTR